MIAVYTGSGGVYRVYSPPPNPGVGVVALDAGKGARGLGVAAPSTRQNYPVERPVALYLHTDTG